VTLEICNLTSAYNGTPVLTGVSDRLPGGQITAVIGCNGAGKSTLFKAISGLCPMQGNIMLDGCAQSLAHRRQSIAYMPQDIGASSSLTVLEVVLLGRLGALGMRVPQGLADQALTALDMFGLASLQTRTLDALSGGQRQLIFLAQALFRAPKVLLLDEPTAALDLRHQLLVLERVRAYARSTGTVVAIAMHDLTLAAQFSDRMAGLKDGRIVAAGPAETVLTPALLETMYGIEAEIETAASGRLRVTPLRATTAAER